MRPRTLPLEDLNATRTRVLLPDLTAHEIVVWASNMFGDGLMMTTSLGIHLPAQAAAPRALVAAAKGGRIDSMNAATCVPRPGTSGKTSDEWAPRLESHTGRIAARERSTCFPGETP